MNSINVMSQRPLLFKELWQNLIIVQIATIKQCPFSYIDLAFTHNMSTCTN